MFLTVASWLVSDELRFLNRTEKFKKTLYRERSSFKAAFLIYHCFHLFISEKAYTAKEKVESFDNTANVFWFKFLELWIVFFQEKFLHEMFLWRRKMQFC